MEEEKKTVRKFNNPLLVIITLFATAIQMPFLFWPAGTIYWLEGWIYLVIFFISFNLISIALNIFKDIVNIKKELSSN